MESVRDQIKVQIKALVSQSLKLTCEINDLKWAEGQKAAAQALKALPAKDPRASGRKKALKAIRRTETADERVQKRMKKLSVRQETRYLLLAYGYMRGREYREFENKMTSQPSHYWLELTINTCLRDAGLPPLGKDAIPDWFKPGNKASEAFLESLRPAIPEVS